MAFKIDPCWFGNRQVVYVHVRLPNHKDKGASKHFIVYGHSLDRVTSEVFHALRKAFGWHGGGHPRIGRSGKKRSSARSK